MIIIILVILQVYCEQIPTPPPTPTPLPHICRRMILLSLHLLPHPLCCLERQNETGISPLWCCSLSGFARLTCFTPGWHDFCFCCYWSSTMGFRNRKKLGSKSYSDSRKNKDPSSKPFFSPMAALVLCPFPALLTEWHVFVKLCGRG